MIVKINKIKNFGIFKNFIWDASIAPFKKRNLIYGWNYSGKTTFSKLFNNLERKGQTHFPSSEYTFEIDRNSETFTQDKLASFPYYVKVFNSFYIKGIFLWERENNEGFEPIYFYLGDEAGNIQPKIDALRNRWNSKVEAIKVKNEAIVNDFADYAKDNGKFSKQATEIRKYLNDHIKSNEFNKSHFIAIAQVVKSDLKKHILTSEEVNEVKQQAIATNDFQFQENNFSCKEGVVELGKQVKEILIDSAPKVIPIPELDENEGLFKWVQSGLYLHEGSSKCKFCDNEISSDRMNLLNQYYSEKLKEIQELILKTKKAITAELTDLNFPFPHERSIVKYLRERYKKAVDDFELQSEKYKKVLDVFISDLSRKEGNYFNSITPSEFDVISIRQALQGVMKVIEEHNLFVLQFAEKKREAQEFILRHYVAEYLFAEDYLAKENAKQIALDLANRCVKRIGQNKEEILRLEGLLKNTVKGQEELNIYLKIFLNREDIQIAIENDKFVLKRGILPATNLSEGEKTAIAFAYFLTELKSLKREEILKDTIIYFDDPISSLDSNHIFQVRSLIQHFFNDKDSYLQLFISTHNFEFFSVLLDSGLFKNENKKDIRPDKCPFYLINRVNDDSSVIKNLPKTLRSHKSEYAHIFSILKEYNDSESKDSFEYKILLPNALRRFLELYTLFKYPKGFCEVDERIKMIFSPDDGLFHNTKLYHWFSHQSQFEKVAHHDGKIILIDDAINEVVKHIEEKDKLHWAGLTAEP